MKRSVLLPIAAEDKKRTLHTALVTRVYEAATIGWATR
jgi:hypothetical protein